MSKLGGKAVNKYRVGQRVRITEDHPLGSLWGIEFTITEVSNEHAGFINGYEYWYKGDPRGFGIWEQCLEPVSMSIEDQLDHAERITELEGEVEELGGKIELYDFLLARLSPEDYSTAIGLIRRVVRNG